MQTVFEIVIRTPLWVWPLMLLVLWLGWSGLRPRVVSPARLAILPLVGLGTSLSGIAQSAKPALALAAWAVALVAALPLGYAFGRGRPVRLLEDGRLAIAGGWFALGFGVSIFAVRYALGVLSGVMPHLRSGMVWICLTGGVGGVITGIGVGWLATLLVRARRLSPVEG
jgi:hypothetical protein